MHALRTAPYWLWLAIVACTHPATPTGSRVGPVSALASAAPTPRPQTTASGASDTGKAADPKAIGAAYLRNLAAQFQPGWGQFLSDCRLRLPPNHALNKMLLAATVEMAIDRAGNLVRVEMFAPSGNADFDRAVREVIADPTPLAVPPTELLSDDDQLHVRWLFARDRRQAEPAAAEIVRVELPLAGVVARLIAANDLARAARRIAVAPHTVERETATTRVMLAALRDALRGLDGSARRAAVEATGQARAVELIAEVRRLLTATSDADLRIAAIAATAELNDVEAVPAMLIQLPNDLAKHPQLALAATRALVRLGHANDAAVVIRRALASDAPNPTALEAFAIAPSFGLEYKLDLWYARGASRTRAAICAALAGIPPPQAARRVQRGFVDRDATVRAACAATAVHIANASPGLSGTLAGWLRPLVFDRDRGVRARAVETIATLDPSHHVDASSDPAPEVRAAYARALTASTPALRALVADRDAEVRSAAWTTLTARQPALADVSPLARQAANDPSPQVRLAALGAIEDIDVLMHIAQTDDAPELRTAAFVRLARKRGRADIADDLLDRLAAATPGTAECVRVALAWLLAK